MVASVTCLTPYICAWQQILSKLLALYSTVPLSLTCTPTSQPLLVTELNCQKDRAFCIFGASLFWFFVFFQFAPSLPAWSVLVRGVRTRRGALAASPRWHRRAQSRGSCGQGRASRGSGRWEGEAGRGSRGRTRRGQRARSGSLHGADGGAAASGSRATRSCGAGAA